MYVFKFSEISYQELFKKIQEKEEKKEEKVQEKVQEKKEKEKKKEAPVKKKKGVQLDLLMDQKLSDEVQIVERDEDEIVEKKKKKKTKKLKFNMKLLKMKK